mmetsp:Transcript_8163/g.18851  ORF Transcript_8163/g.18851 Transcript_8163/m.18851 type:complete len:406 (-) Transcript_8163:77-1294(-)
MLSISELQGTWVASRGETIVIEGDQIALNGVRAARGFNVDADGGVSGFSIYQLKDVLRGDKVEEVFWQSKFSEYDVQRWSRVDQQEIDQRNADTQAKLTDRAAICGGSSFGALSDAECVLKLNSLIKQWSEGPLVKVRSCDVCPDICNRQFTGLSVDHVHFVATCIRADGFKDRAHGGPDAHDIPVLVREQTTSELGAEAVAKWKAAVRDTPQFPPFLLDSKSEVFCSLGSGHFSQALNLFRVEGRSMWSAQRYIAREPSLRKALDEGISSIVLSAKMPTNDRRFVAEMLNITHGRKWRVGEDGKVEIEDGETTQASQFVALSKVLDADELGILVRLKLGVSELKASDCTNANWHDFQPQSCGDMEDGDDAANRTAGQSSEVRKNELIPCCGLWHILDLLCGVAR